MSKNKQNQLAIGSGTTCHSTVLSRCDNATLREVSEALLELFNKPNFAVKGLPFPLAVELFAVLKSIIAVAAGYAVSSMKYHECWGIA